MNNKKIVILPGMVEEVKTRKDKSFKISIGTQEMLPEDAALLFSMVHGYGNFAFSPSQINESDIRDVPDTVPEFKNDKSKSQRLRNVLYVYWKQEAAKGKLTCAFDSFYSACIEDFINRTKEKLDDI